MNDSNSVGCLICGTSAFHCFLQSVYLIFIDISEYLFVNFQGQDVEKWRNDPRDSYVYEHFPSSSNLFISTLPLFSCIKIVEILRLWIFPAELLS
ncbi:Cysteine-rich venom protein [Trichinella spiralis]|uniref:Cysteine-rich venom protein n=1 Tax=Trichinella spiralis TaxID=6334 RepID=A0ABR3K3M1_TRISP